MEQPLGRMLRYVDAGWALLHFSGADRDLFRSLGDARQKAMAPANFSKTGAPDYRAAFLHVSGGQLRWKKDLCGGVHPTRRAGALRRFVAANCEHSLGGLGRGGSVLARRTMGCLDCL